MVFHSAKESLTREEVLDILRRNVKLYKNEPEFVNYIVDLALFLLENLADRKSDTSEQEEREGGRLRPGSNVQLERFGLPVKETGEALLSTPTTPPPRSASPSAPPSAPPVPAGGESKLPRVQVDKGGRTRVYKVFRAHTNTVESAHCPICGSETGGERICPNCGNVL